MELVTDHVYNAVSSYLYSETNEKVQLRYFLATGLNIADSILVKGIHIFPYQVRTGFVARPAFHASGGLDSSSRRHKVDH
jgi:hypothetical protein